MSGRRRRVLLALDASPACLAAIEASAELAEALEAELEGLFVEDRELFALAGHPLARGLDPFTGSLEALDAEVLGRRLRAQAARVRTRLARTADRRGLAWSFRVERAGVVEALRGASAAVDVVTLGRVGWSERPRPGLGSTVQALLAEGPAALLINGRPSARDAPVAVATDGSPAGRAALELAAELAARRRVRLDVAVLAGDETRAADLTREVEAALAGRAPGWPGHRVESPGGAGDLAEALGAWLARRGHALVVLPMSLGGGPEELRAFVGRVECPVLLLRSPGPPPAGSG